MSDKLFGFICGFSIATIELDNDKSAINNKSHGLKRLRIDAPENIRIIRAAK